MMALVFISGLLGLSMVAVSLPHYANEIRRIFSGEEFVPGALGAFALIFALGCTLLGVAVWLSLIF